jgi:hypothetical protein
VAVGSEKVAEQARIQARDLLNQATVKAAAALTQSVKDAIPNVREAAEAALTTAAAAVAEAGAANTTKDAKAACGTAENAADQLQSADLVARDLVADAGDTHVRRLALDFAPLMCLPGLDLGCGSTSLGSVRGWVLPAARSDSASTGRKPFGHDTRGGR